MNDQNRTDPQGFEPFEPSPPSLSSSTDPQRTMSKDPTQRAGWERATLEKLAFAALNEQKATRRWKTFTRLAWLAIRGQVYDVTSWVNAHLGGKDTILLNSGRDATQLFEGTLRGEPATPLFD